MNETVLSLWQLLGGVLELKAEAFQEIAQLSVSPILALIVVLVAGLSQGVAQSIILFINRVQPVRFIFSLLIGAVLFTFGYIFLVLSTWVITLTPFMADVPLELVARILGFSYAPLLFSFLGALPYGGVPLLNLLSVWHLLAMVVGFSSVTSLSRTESLAYVAVGWLVLQVLQQTIGQPLANLGRWLANKTAGVELVTSSEALLEILQQGGHSSPPLQVLKEGLDTVTRSVSNQGSTQSATGSPGQSAAEPSSDRRLKTILGLIGMTLLTLLVIISLVPFWHWERQSQPHLPRELQLAADLVRIGGLGLIVAGLLAPLETLGWWAGWYNDEVDTQVNVGELAEPIADASAISRYVIYLDGIGQSTFKYLPDVEVFLERLTQALPDNIALIKGIMPYSVLNNPLDEDRPLAFLWQLADRLRFKNPASLLGLLVNVRNILTVAVSADQRYGPIYNQGIAQVMYNALLNYGYQLNSGMPITLIGYSGGGQMAAAAAPILGRALGASTSIEVISLGGVISGNCNLLKLEHLYHLKGDKDGVEQLGPVMFPGRWPIFPLSYWNRAKRRGKIDFISLGPVGHQVPGGLMDPDSYLPDGRSHLQQTVESVIEILEDKLSVPQAAIVSKSSNYQRYRQAPFTDPSYYPISQTVSPGLYRPIGTWMGRLILPKLEERWRVRGCLFEVYHAGEGYEHLVGKVVNLRWSERPSVRAKVSAVTKDVYFSEEAKYTYQYGGLVQPVRIDRWRQVNPLESLAGSHSVDDVVVMLSEPVTVDEFEGSLDLYIDREPIQITGRYYGLVRFIGVAGEEQFQVVHFNPQTRQFDGEQETVNLPQVIPDLNGVFPSKTEGIEASPLNAAGWYIYGASDSSGQFVVQSLAPRALLRLQPDKVLFGSSSGWNYIRHESWSDLIDKKGNVESVSVSPLVVESEGAAVEEWKEGDEALVIHTYGGIGGKKREPEAQGPIYFGHFAYGVARVVWEPLADELRFDIRYYQVYTHNADGLIAGTLHWSRYLGDRQFGWVGVRPIADILIKYPPFTEPVEVAGKNISALRSTIDQLEAMTARYRIGDGTGATYVAPANNCSQDSNRALFASLQQIENYFQTNADFLDKWLALHPQFSGSYKQFVRVEKALKRELQFFGSPRRDWEKNEYNLGSTLEDEPLRNLWMGLGSWRAMFPRLASDTIAHIFLEQGASVWVLRANQIGGFDPDIEPVAPNTL